MLRRMRTYNEEVPLVVTLWGRQWTREELLARVGLWSS